MIYAIWGVLLCFEHLDYVFVTFLTNVTKLGVTFVASLGETAVTPKVVAFGISVLERHIIKVETPIWEVLLYRQSLKYVLVASRPKGTRTG